MVNYNAFNVDPLRYQQAAMGNLQNALAMRDRREQAAVQNAFNQQQRADLERQRGARNVMEETRMANVKSRFEEEQEFKYKKAAFESALTAPNPEAANKNYKQKYKSLSGRDATDEFEFSEVGPTTEIVGDSPQGKILMRVPTHKAPGLMDALNRPEVNGNQQLTRQVLADFGAAVKPYEGEKKGFKTGETREIKRGGKIVTQEYDGKKWTQISEGPRFKPSGAKSKMTQTEAMEEKKNLAVLRHKIETTGGLDSTTLAMMATFAPDLAEKAASTDTEEVYKALDEWGLYLDKFAYPEGKPEKKTRYTYESGKLIKK